MEVRRLHPDPGPIDTAELLTGLRLGERAPDGRPYVIANMVSTVDGAASVGGDTEALGNAADLEVFMSLRAQVDAVMVGTGTLAVEEYGRLVRKPERRAIREAEGLAPDPLGLVVTRSGRLPLDIPLFSDEHSTVAVYTSVPELDVRCAADVRVTRLDPGELTMATVLARARADHGVRSVLCEGGPIVLGAVVAEGLLDELFLTIDPQLHGGATAPTILEGTPLSKPAAVAPVWVLEHEGALFVRYAITRPSDAPSR